MFETPVWQARANPAPVTPAAIRLSRGGSKLSIDVAPAAGTERLVIMLKPSFKVAGASLDDRTVALVGPANRWANVIFAGPPANGVKLELPIPAHGEVEVRTLQDQPGWPAGPAPPKPVDRMAFGLSDYTVVLSGASDRW